MIVELTQHAIERGKERFNFSSKTLLRCAQKAFEEGTHHEHAKGLLGDWARGKVDRGANHLRILGHQGFLFFDNLLLTVLVVPHEARPKVHKPMKLSQLNRPTQDFEEEDLEEDEGMPDIR